MQRAVVKAYYYTREKEKPRLQLVEISRNCANSDAWMYIYCRKSMVYSIGILCTDASGRVYSASFLPLFLLFFSLRCDVRALEWI